MSLVVPAETEVPHPDSDRVDRILVVDDDELRTAAQLIDQVDQSAEVYVVEGGLDLVENIERTRSRLE